MLRTVQSTYKFRTDFQTYAYYANGKRNKIVNRDTVSVCYRTVDVLDLFLFNGNLSKQLPIKRMPLHYEDNYTKALSIRYSLKVSQFTITKPAYEYWNTIKKLRDMQGELYTQQPYRIKNNLRNKTHPEKPALGYFTVAGIMEKRIFVNPPKNFQGRYDMCTVDDAPVKHLDDMLSNRPDLWPFFLIDPAIYQGDFWVDRECVDCRTRGVLEKPKFWID